MKRIEGKRREEGRETGLGKGGGTLNLSHVHRYCDKKVMSILKDRQTEEQNGHRKGQSDKKRQTGRENKM